MHQPSRDEYFDEIRSSAAVLADIVVANDPELPVPTCPDWNLSQLVEHVGRVHRWAAQIVTTRSPERVPFDSAPDGVFPDAVADQAAWMTSGADRLIEAIRAAGEDAVWAFGRMAPASFWARRQAHETAMHRIDAELAVGRTVVLDPALAADGIDEWLEIVTSPRNRGRHDLTEALPVGAALHLRATQGDRRDDEAAEWVVRRTGGEGLHLQRESGDADVSVTGPADSLLLALVRRAPADEPGLAVTGDAAVFSRWLAGTPF